MKRIVAIILSVMTLMCFAGCDDKYNDSGSKEDIVATMSTASHLQETQPTPTRL